MYKIAKGKQKDKAKQQLRSTRRRPQAASRPRSTRRQTTQGREGGKNKKHKPHTHGKAKVQRSRRTTPQKAPRDFISPVQKKRTIDETKTKPGVRQSVGIHDSSLVHATRLTVHSKNMHIPSLAQVQVHPSFTTARVCSKKIFASAAVCKQTTALSEYLVAFTHSSIDSIKHYV